MLIFHLRYVKYVKKYVKYMSKPNTSTPMYLKISGCFYTLGKLSSCKSLTLEAPPILHESELQSHQSAL